MPFYSLCIGIVLVVATAPAAGSARPGASIPHALSEVAAAVDASPQRSTGGTNQQTPEEIMNRRFPQSVRVADLIGLPVLDYFDATIGYVRNVVRHPGGKVQLVVTHGGWPAGWSIWLSRLVPVPIEMVAILGRQIVALEMSRDDFERARTWSPGDGEKIDLNEMIKIAISRR